MFIKRIKNKRQRVTTHFQNMQKTVVILFKNLLYDQTVVSVKPCSTTTKNQNINCYILKHQTPIEKVQQSQKNDKSDYPCTKNSKKFKTKAKQLENKENQTN